MKDKDERGRERNRAEEDQKVKDKDELVTEGKNEDGKECKG